MPNDLMTALRAARLAFDHAAMLWPTHTESVRALALDALRVGIGETTLTVLARAAEAFSRADDFGRADDIAAVLAALGACANCDLAFGDVSRRACWRDAGFPCVIDGARQAIRRLAEAGPPQKTTVEIAAELERRRHTRFPGVRVLAREYGINAGDMSRIISRSAALRDWRARHTPPARHD